MPFILGLVFIGGLVTLFVVSLSSGSANSKKKKEIAMLEEELASLEAQLKRDPQNEKALARRAEIVRTLKIQYPLATKGKYENYEY